jgi:hypothetical protein
MLFCPTHNCPFSVGADRQAILVAKSEESKQASDSVRAPDFASIEKAGMLRSVLTISAEHISSKIGVNPSGASTPLQVFNMFAAEYWRLVDANNPYRSDSKKEG